MSVDLNNLKTSVANEQTVEQSAITLIQGLAQQLIQISSGTTDQATQIQLDDLVNQMNFTQTALASAVSANTQVQGNLAPKA